MDLKTKEQYDEMKFFFEKEVNGCPQCFAVEYLMNTDDESAENLMGYRIACKEVLFYNHECGLPDDN